MIFFSEKEMEYLEGRGNFTANYKRVLRFKIRQKIKKAEEIQKEVEWAKKKLEALQ